MRIRPNIGPGCFDAASKAAGDRLSKEEVNEAFQRVFDYKQKLQAEGNLDGMADKLRTFAEREAERTKIAAAMQRRHAAMNVLVRDRMDQAIDGLMRAGLSPQRALLAVLEGTQRGVEGGRNSVAALNLAYEARYLGGLFAELQKNRPYMVNTLRDPKMDADIMREMSELREGGTPGITKNKDAQYVAKLFASYAELSRTDLNKLGASIGKLDGWAGAQIHDDVRMIAAGKEAWTDAILPRLDMDRTFPDAVDEAQVKELLGDVYDTLVTGFPNRATPKEKGQRVNPANLARSLGKSRVLHFKDGDAALAYREEFGYGNTVSGMISHLRRAARVAANMEALGPNPEVMFGSLVDGMKRRIKDDPKLSPAEKQKRMRGLDAEAGKLKQALDVSTGMISRPVNVTAAKIGSDIRAVQSMAKLGGATITALSDTITPAVASMFRGTSFFRGLTAQLDGLRKGRPKGEFAEISYMIGEGFDGLIGHIVAPAAATDGPVGRLSRLQESFFKWNGLTWWTDVQRATAGRVISAEMGMRAKTDFDSLPANYKHVLGLHGINAKKWDAIRKSRFREVEGKEYVTPDRIRELDDAAIEPLVADRIAAARKASKSDEAFEAKRAQIIEDGRRDLELSVLRFFADETSYGVVEVDASTRRIMTQGLRPGTAAGEAIRFVGQFKGFPFTFANRIVGRALFGHRKDATILDKTAHIGALLAGMTIAGYMSMTMKDIIRGYWPPRDPTDVKTWQAAALQGGAFGIYGDFLFAQTNRFGGGLAETVIGPSIGSVLDSMTFLMKARDGDASAADALSIGLQNTPFVNLFYTRPALDYLFLNSMRDAVSPGYLKRQETRRRKEYGQRSSVEREAFPGLFR
ncbi:hypothetical protein [Chelativorans xinjiangense]|uniref:hypothetical protein n=1 Tax=Chelativorans xinjiangense TaxID=2681485 RepID=UPI00135A495E|nr:hypothetical protein [Chelativorans xinjiangense]